MVSPVTGPTSQSVNLPAYYLSRQRYSQKRPYNLQLPYFCKMSQTLNQTKPTFPPLAASNAFSGPEANWTTPTNQAKTVAYERLLGAISDRASMGENLGEMSESIHLITAAARSTLGLLKAFKRADISLYGQWLKYGPLGIPSKRNLKDRFNNATKTAANRTLEWNFAIKPNIEDCFSAISILQNPIKSPRVRGRGSSFSSQSTMGTQPPFSREWSSFAKVAVEYGCRVAINNPNLFLANSLGLINPVQIAWQLAPGSFLIDWFLPVEQFLGHGTDFLGLSVESQWTTTYISGVYSEFWTTYEWKALCSFAKVERGSGFSLPSLAFRPLKIPSWHRAANAVSLLRQMK